MTHIVVDPDEIRWADTATVLAQAGIDRKLLNDWVRRGLVDQPRLAGGLWWYQLDQVLDVELSTVESGYSSRSVHA